MWKLFKGSPTFSSYLHYSLKIHARNVRQIKSYTAIRNNLNRIRNNQASLPTFPTITKVALTLSGGSIIQIVLSRNLVLCEPKKTRLAGFRHVGKEAKFDWSLFWHYIRPHIWYLLAAIAGALAVAILNIQIPQIMGGVINVIAKFNENKDSDLFMREVRVPALKLVAMYAVQSVCTFFYIYMLSNLGEKISYKMKMDLFTSVLNQDVAFFDQQRTGEIINRLTSDIQDFKSSFKQTVSGGLRASAQIVGCSVSLLMISPQMTFVTLLCIPSVIAIGSIFGSILRATSRKAQAQTEKTTSVANEAISNIRTVRAFAMEEQECELFENEAALAMGLNQNLGFGIGIFQAGTNMFLNSMVLSTLYMGGYLLSTNQLTAGEMMAFLMASQTIQRSLSQISLLFGSVVRGIAAGSRVFEYINLKPTMSLRGGRTISDDLLTGHIEFKNVTFAYPSRPEQTILHNFNLTVPAGKTVAIVGASGNGKSTVVALLERFYDIKNGLITLDGADIRVLDPSWLRGRVLGLISQEPILFGTTVLENIRYGRPDATDEEVRQAARLANADEFIANFPHGYNTMVGERGATLSGGQKQRIAIARALLKNPAVCYWMKQPVLWMLNRRKFVQSALEQARKGRTVIVIAHRLSTIQNADLIVVLNKGQIVEMGTHAALQKLKGYYWSLTYQQQQHTPAG